MSVKIEKSSSLDSFFPLESYLLFERKEAHLGVKRESCQDIADEWGMGMNGDKLLPIHPQGGWMGMNGGWMDIKGEDIIHPHSSSIYPPFIPNNV